MATMTDIKKGLDILCKHIAEDDNYIAAEHDTICFSGDRSTMTKKEIIQLDDLGFIWDAQEDCWMHFT